jgi:dGTPase
LRDNLYPSKEILKLELRGRRVVHDLMDLFWEGARVGVADIKAKDYPGKAYKLAKGCALDIPQIRGVQ